MSSGGKHHGGCEWSPHRKAAAMSDDPHHRSTFAVWLLGANGKWRLCDECVDAKDFSRLQRTRIPLTTTTFLRSPPRKMLAWLLRRLRAGRYTSARAECSRLNTITVPLWWRYVLYTSAWQWLHSIEQLVATRTTHLLGVDLETWQGRWLDELDVPPLSTVIGKPNPPDWVLSR